MSALKTLQTASGVLADGEFGPKTLKAAAAHLGLSRVRAAHFFAQTSHETGGFKIFEENLRYRPERLLQIFPRYFPTNASASKVALDPEATANVIYANRMGNGPPESGDGYRFRGRGAIQLTGRDNYTKYGYASNPEKVADEAAFESALKFFEKLWPIADQGISPEVIAKLTKRINGGTLGLEERTKLTQKYWEWLC